MTTRDNGRVPSPNCRCDGCQALAARYKDDPKPLAFYRRKLLQRGWAGNLDDVERGYLAAHASWYKAQQEQGQRLAASFPGGTLEHHRHGRKGVDGEAPGPGAEVETTPGRDQGVGSEEPLQLSLELVA